MRAVVYEFMSLDGVMQAPAVQRKTHTAALPMAAGRGG
jgi:hypothetical protein